MHHFILQRIQQNAFLGNDGHQSIENVIMIAKERCEFLQRIAGTMKLHLHKRKSFWIRRSISRAIGARGAAAPLPFTDRGSFALSLQSLKMM